jgi:hypothetical protein
MTTLPDADMNDLQQFLTTVIPLDQTIRFEFGFLKTGDVINPLPGTAPHFICFYSENKGRYLMNAGFILQQVDLYLSAHDVGSCWLGVARPVMPVRRHKNGLEFLIMLAFGRTDEPVHRPGPAAFKRVELSAMTSITGADELLEPVRLAPSASNSQPWFISGNTSELMVCRKKLNPIRSVLYGKINQIDIGIALCHLWLGMDFHGETALFDFQAEDAKSGNEVFSGYELMARVRGFAIDPAL